MKSTVVNKTDLLITVRKNKEKHEAMFNETLEKRLIEIRQYHEVALAWMDANPDKQPSEARHFPMPENNIADYERAIAMLQMDTRQEIELSSQEFDQLVMDNWHWKANFLRTATVYGANQ